MENATQALIMAAGVLIGVIILSLGVYLFYIFGGFSADTQEKVDETQIAQFNQKFTQYAGRDDLTIQDVITAKNYALEHNKGIDSNYNSGEEISKRANNANDYIDVFYSGTCSLLILKQNKDSRTYLAFIHKDESLLMSSDSGQTRFSCEVEFNNTTGRVNRVYFWNAQI